MRLKLEACGRILADGRDIPAGVDQEMFLLAIDRHRNGDPVAHPGHGKAGDAVQLAFLGPGRLALCRDGQQDRDGRKPSARYCWVLLAVAALAGGSFGLGGVDASLMKILLSPNAM
jgi:hypothetical protein